MKKIRVGLVGANGRMGQEITALLHANRIFEASVAILRAGGSADAFKKSVKGFEKIGSKELDVLIDFSSAQMSAKSIQFCVRHRLPLITGVTGLAPEDFKLIEKASKKIAILHSANMSMGVAILKAAIGLLAELKGFDFQVVESHHRFKKDTPSGTALALQAELEKVTRKKWPAPLAMRVGGVIGEHEIVAASQGEVIRLNHEALNRGIFAAGALRAAEFIVRQEPGLYKMEDVLRGSH